MCGIAGFYSNKVSDDYGVSISNILHSIGHRGPDQLGAYYGSRYAIGTARLSINDFQGGEQPFVGDHYLLVFNGEIFNHIELRKRHLQDRAFQTNSEIETLGLLYERFGLDMFVLLNGQFAIAILDRAKMQLILARDPVGIRPLYYSVTKDDVVFSSEIKGISCFTEHSLSVSARSLVQTVHHWTNVGDQTAFDGVKQVLPGGLLICDLINMSTANKIFRDLFEEQVPELRLSSDEDYFDTFREQLLRAVGRQSMSDTEVGCYVSGGIDSTAIALNLRKVLGRGVSSYSLGFSNPDYDESEEQDNVTRFFGLRNRRVSVTESDIGEIFPTTVSHAEAILFRTAPAPLFLLSRLVRDDGVKVVMTGEGSDEFLLGYDIFREIKIRRFVEKNKDSKFRSQLFRTLHQYLPQYKNPRYFNLLVDMYKSTLVGEHEFYGSLVKWRNSSGLRHILNSELLQCENFPDPVQDLRDLLSGKYNSSSDIGRLQEVECKTLLQNYLLSSQGDRMTMANSVEGRYPFLDLEFLDFCRSLPENMKLRGLKDKFILREAYSMELPVEIRRRPKIAYQAPELRVFFDGNGKLREYCEDVLSEDYQRRLGLFDLAEVERLKGIRLGSTNNRISFRDNMAMVVMVSTSLLARQFSKQCTGRTRFEQNKVRRKEFFSGLS